MTMDVSTLASIYCANRKVECPVCGKRFMSPSYMPFKHSAIGAHIRSCHPELEAQVYAVVRQIEKEKEEEKAREEEEARRRPLREFTVAGEFLDEIKREIQSLIGMMEPYYSQCITEVEGERLIERIEEMHDQARRAEAAR